MKTILETLVGSKLRAKILGWLFSHPDERYYVRQLTALLKADSTNVSRELARLAKIGILTSSIEGRQKYYQANGDNSLFSELKGIANKTRGLPDIVPADPVAQRFNIPQARLAEYCRRHHIQKLALFGSVLGDDFRPDSDVDVLVEFKPGYVPGFGIVEMERELSQLIGREVDLRTPNDLSRYFRQRVVRESRVKYAET
jgi:uncharacterized protein